MTKDAVDTPTPPPPSETKLKDILPRSFSVLLDTFDDDDYERAYASLESLYRDLEIERDRAMEGWTATSAALAHEMELSEVRRQEIETLTRDTIAAEDAEHRTRTQILGALGALDDVVPWEARCHGETLAQRIEYVKGELSALRSLQLTPEEAGHVLATLGSQYGEDCRPGLFGKLRAVVEASNGR